MNYFGWTHMALLYYGDPTAGKMCVAFAQSVLSWFNTFSLSISYMYSFENLMNETQTIDSVLTATKQYARSKLTLFLSTVRLFIPRFSSSNVSSFSCNSVHLKNVNKKLRNSKLKRSEPEISHQTVSLFGYEKQKPEHRVPEKGHQEAN